MTRLVPFEFFSSLALMADSAEDGRKLFRNTENLHWNPYRGVHMAVGLENQVLSDGRR